MTRYFNGIALVSVCVCQCALVCACVFMCVCVYVCVQCDTLCCCCYCALLVLAIVVALCVRCALLNVLDVVAMSDCHAPATLNKKKTLLNQIVCGYSSDYTVARNYRRPNEINEIWKIPSSTTTVELWKNKQAYILGVYVMFVYA